MMPAGRSITIADIAKAAGVSKPVVSKVLHDRGGNTRVSPATVERVREVAGRLGYRPHAKARSMALGGTGQLGILLPHAPDHPFTHPAAYETIIGIDAVAHVHARSTVLANLNDARAGLDQMRIIRERVVDGFCVLGMLPGSLVPGIERAAPSIWVDGNRWSERGCLRRDEEAAGHSIARRVQACAYRRCLFYGYAGSEHGHFSSAARRRGVQTVLDSAGIACDQVVEQGAGSPAAEALIARLRPDLAVVADSIYQALQLRSLAEGAGLLPGRDYGIGCCDDMRQIDRWWPQLSRVSFPRFDLGQTAARMLIDYLTAGEAPASQLLTGELIEGDTLRPQD